MNTKELNKLNDNIETLNKNLEMLLNKMSNPTLSMVSGPEVAEMISSADLGGMVIPLNIKSMMSKGLDMSVQSNGVNVVKVMRTHAEYRSSCFNEIQYNPKNKELTVFFKGSSARRAYTYMSIDLDVYQDFISANSLGGFYMRNIKGNYRCVTK